MLHFADLDIWSGLRNLIRSGEIERIDCNACGSSIRARSPILLEIPSRNISVFVTHAGDDSAVDDGFRTLLYYAEVLLGSFEVESVRRRPYAFVHGWPGLLGLLAAFEGKEPGHPGPPYPHQTEDSNSIGTLSGYAYGMLFFYYPDQVAVAKEVGVLLRFAGDAKTAAQASTLLECMQTFTAVVGGYHPWVLKEMGRLAMMAGRIDEAIEHLKRSARAEHRWLAPTMGFLDATPKTRTDGPTQRQELPHARPVDQLTDVTRDMHLVTRFGPERTKDYGLWHFPAMEASVVPSTYTPANLLTVRGVVMGTLERLLWDDHWAVGRFTVFNLMELLQDTRETLVELSQKPDTRPVVQDFWRNYTRCRWLAECDLSAAPRDEILEAIRHALSRIQERLDELPAESPDSPFELFSKGYNAHDMRYALQGAKNELRRMLGRVDV